MIAMDKKAMIIRVSENTKNQLEKKLEQYNLSVQKTLTSVIDLILSDKLPLSTEGIKLNDNNVIATDSNNDISLIHQELESIKTRITQLESNQVIANDSNSDNKPNSNL
jgi:hypothetical protein